MEDNWGGDIQGPMRSEEMAGYEDEVPGDYNITEGEEDYDRRPSEVDHSPARDKYPLTRIVLITPWELGHLKDEGGWDSIAHMLSPLSIADVLENGNVYADSGNQLYEMYVVEGYLTEEFEADGLRILGMDEPTKIIHNIKAWKTSGGSMYAVWHDFIG